MAGAEDERLRDALLELDAITRRLRRECPWDREQDERSIVPHTVEEAYELADAAHSGDDAKLLDELGDVLFQVYFLSLLLEERGAGDLASVADAHPREAGAPPPAHLRSRRAGRAAHEATTAAEVKQNWDAIKQREPGARSVAEALPALTYARKRLRGSARPAEPEAALARVAQVRAGRAAGRHHGSDELYEAVGDLLLAVVDWLPRPASTPRSPCGARRPRCERDPARARAADPRLAWQSDRRGRRAGSTSGANGRAAVPSGASTGEFEAVELRDGGPRWGGKGVMRRGRQRERGDRARA